MGESLDEQLAEQPGEQPVGPVWRWIDAMFGAVIAVAIALSLEIVLVAMLHPSQLAGPWELRAALVWLWPVAVVVWTPVTVMTVAGLLLLYRGGRVKRAAVTLVSGGAAGALFWGLSTGRHFQHLAVRGGFVAVGALATAALVWFWGAWLVGWIQRRHKQHEAMTLLGFAVCAVGLEVANQLVLPRLYYPFHIALSVLSVGCVAWLGAWVVIGQELTHSAAHTAGQKIGKTAVDRPSRLSRRWLRGAGAALLAICVGGSVVALEKLVAWDNLRMMYMTYAPSIGHVVRVAALAQPRRMAHGELETMPLAQGQPSERFVDWRDRDLLLVSIDALRADHLGVYDYKRPVSPNIDALAKKGVVFERAYTAMPNTSYAITSLLMGKYMRSLVLQGIGKDSDTLASVLRTYGYRTAAFYPPSVFYIDEDKFQWVKESGFDFEYRKEQYGDAEVVLRQVLDYLHIAPQEQRVFVWAHFFDPHEPYAPPAKYSFGERAIDRYDGEIAAADDATGKLVRAMLDKRPDTVVIITADHGEAFGEHGAYYHGTTVYEEQTRVPLIVIARGLEPRRIAEPVQLIDVMPTVLEAMHIPRRPRLRGRNLGPLLAGKGAGEGFAVSETHDQVMLAQGQWRLVCARNVDACSLFDLKTDPQQLKDVSPKHPERVASMKKELRAVESSHGVYERAGARAEGKELPPQLVRGIAGDGEAAQDVAGLLDDADVQLRRKAAEVLFQLGRKETSAALSLAVARDEDEQVRNWSALALTKLGYGAPLTTELLQSNDLKWRRLAALVLGQGGDGRGETTLLEWWDDENTTVAEREELVRAFGILKCKAAVVGLTKWLDNQQLRGVIAQALGKIGDGYGKVMLLRYFEQERYVHARQQLAEALLELGATRELAPGLARFLGVPDPLAKGLQIAVHARVLGFVGGPNEKDLERLTKVTTQPQAFRLVLPKGGNGKGFRLLVLTDCYAEQGQMIRFGREAKETGRLGASSGLDLQLDPEGTVRVHVPVGEDVQTFVELPKGFGAQPGGAMRMVVVGHPKVQLKGFAVVPLANEIPPPPPEPWQEQGNERPNKESKRE